MNAGVRRSMACALALMLPLGSGACNKSKPDEGSDKGSEQDGSQGSSQAQHVALAATALAFVGHIRELETTKDVTCWTSFRQLDNFIAAKSYSDFATITKIMAAKALAHAVWAAASKKAEGAQVDVGDLDAVFSIEAELDEAKKAELQKFAEDLGWQQFHDYRTTSEHWRVLLAVAQDELAKDAPQVKPLTEQAQQRLALITTRLSLSLLTESGQIATQARTPLIETEHVKKAYENLSKRHELPEPPDYSGKLDHQRANESRVPLTAELIAAKITALRHYNKSTDDLKAELNKISKIPIDQGATDRMVGELMSMTRFFAKGYEPMRADNYLADGNFAPAKLETKPYITPSHVENVTQQIFPYVMLPNGDVKLRFEPRPGHVTERDLEGQDVTLLDHHMNAVRDTALPWVILQRVFKDDAFAMDPFAAEYLSELVSIVATFYLRRAQTIARQLGKETIDAEVIGQVRDVGYVQVMPQSPEGQARSWGPEQDEAKAAVLANYRAPMYRDVTAAWGLPTKLPGDVEHRGPGDETFDIQTVMGSGTAVGDVDGDGHPDLFVAGQGLGRLFLNQKGKRFEDATDKWKIPGGLDDARGALFVDYDGDSDLDLVVMRSRNPSLLLRNDGEAFTDVAKEAGFVTGHGAHVTTAFDYDLDGDLDLYVGYYGSAACNEGKCEGRNLPSLDGRNGTPNQLFRNTGGSFEEVGASAGVADEGWTLAASTFDYDGDGDFDIYLANDFGANPLYQNQGDGTFTDVAVDVGAADRGSGMNVTFADVDGNGEFDVFVSNIDMFSKNIKIVFPSDESVVKLSDQILRSFQYLSGNKLYFNEPGDGGVAFVPREVQWFEPGDKGWGWAGLFFDYELDGDEDIYLANGWIPESPAADQRNQLYLRDGETFYKVPEDHGGDESFAGNSRSVVAFDMDGDGDLDLLVNNYAQPPKLLRNEQRSSNHWLMVRLQGGGANTAAVGARVEATTKDGVQRRLVTAGNGYLGQDDAPVHFGLGPHEQADVTILWPDGSKTTSAGLSAGKIHELKQGEGTGGEGS